MGDDDECAALISDRLMTTDTSKFPRDPLRYGADYIRIAGKRQLQAGFATMLSGPPQKGTAQDFAARAAAAIKKEG